MMKAAGLAGVFALLLTSLASATGYFETSFEIEEGYAEGELANPDLPWGVVTGAAEVVEDDAVDGEQALRLVPGDPTARVRLQSRTLAESDQLFVDFWVRPVATEGEMECLDFDGALIGFTRAGEDGNEGEVKVFHATSDVAGHWIATGKRFALNAEGVAEHMIRVTVLRDHGTGSWHLWLDGEVAFQNVRALPADRENVRSVWLFGDETAGMLVDRFYLGAINPFLFRHGAERFGNSGVRRAATDFPQIVGRRTEPRRTALPNMQFPPGPLTEPVLRGYRFEGKQGDEVNVAKTVVNFLDGSDRTRISAFAPRYDDAGNPLPMDITFVADVELKAGVDLRRVFWEVRRLPKQWEPRIDGELLKRGNFDGTLARVVTIDGEDVRKGMSVDVTVE
ncbi:MAG: hypothetical protein WA771_03660 [Chthoniobacterales bacterium]